MEGAVASVKEVTAKGAMEIQSEQIKELQQSSEEHFQWLKDAAQVVVVSKNNYRDACFA